MAAKKFLRNVLGVISEAFGVVVSAGAANDGDIPALDATGRLDSSVMPIGIGADSQIVTASEALAANDFVNIYNNGGAFGVRKADGTSAAKYANGYVTAAVANGAAATVYFDDANGGTALNPGDKWLSVTTPGKTQDTAPTAAGQIAQKLGVATSATVIHVKIDQFILLA